jgi:Putative transposase
LEAGDAQGIQRLIQYFLRCPFSQARMIEVTEAGKVIYKTEHNAVGRFPEPGDEELLAGPSRNFQIFDPLDFLAEVTQHIPENRPTLLSEVRRPNEDHRLHRAASDRGDREDSPALRAVGRGFGAGTSGSPSEGGGRKEQAGGPSGAPGAKPDGRLEGRALFA